MSQALSTANTHSTAREPGERRMPPLVRLLAGIVYAGLLYFAFSQGVQLAWNQVPPLDPTKDGPVSQGTRIQPDVLPTDYPLAREQAALRDYLFTQAAGQDATPYIEEGRVLLLEQLASTRMPQVPPPAGDVATEPPQVRPQPGAGVALEVIKYDGDLVQLQVTAGDGSSSQPRKLWGPKKPLADAVKSIE